MTLSVLIFTCPIPPAPPQDSFNSSWTRIWCPDKPPRIIFPLERSLCVPCRHKMPCVELMKRIVQKFSLERISSPPPLKFPWASSLTVLNQQRAQHFQRKGKSKSQLLPDRGFSPVSTSSCFFFLPSLLLLSTAHTILRREWVSGDRSKVVRSWGWDELTSRYEKICGVLELFEYLDKGYG